jgi:hypothetical protein
MLGSVSLRRLHHGSLAGSATWADAASRRRRSIAKAARGGAIEKFAIN